MSSVFKQNIPVNVSVSAIIFKSGKDNTRWGPLERASLDQLITPVQLKNSYNTS
jgi:hypothetical protein